MGRREERSIVEGDTIEPWRWGTEGSKQETESETGTSYTPLRHEERDEARTGQASRGDSHTGYGMNAQGAGGAIRMSPHNVIVNCKD